MDTEISDVNTIQGGPVGDTARGGGTGRHGSDRTFADLPDEQLPDGLRAVRAVLLELADILADYRETFVVAGGIAPLLLLPPPGEDGTAGGGYRGQSDVGLVLDLPLLEGRQVESAAKTMGATLLRHLYRQQRGTPFRWQRGVDLPDRQRDVLVTVDLLAPARYGVTDADRAVRRRVRDVHEVEPSPALGVDLALVNPVTCYLSGLLPDGLRRAERAPVRVIDLGMLVAFKAVAFADRLRAHEKEPDAGHDRQAARHASDLGESLDRYPGGLEALAARLRPSLAAAGGDPLVAEAVGHLRTLFADPDGDGPRLLLTDERYRFDDDAARSAGRRAAAERVTRLLNLLDSGEPAP